VHDQAGPRSGREFLKELKQKYRKLRGIRWWFSLTDCAKVRFVKVSSAHQSNLIIKRPLTSISQFVCISEGLDFIVCSPDAVKIDEIRATSGYEMSKEDALDDSSHVAWVESILRHCLQQFHYFVRVEQVNAIISGLPKKIEDNQATEGTCGYGIKAIHGWLVAKILVIFGIGIILGLVHFSLWLSKHPGDL
jgi:hypothetical protein